MSKNIGVYQVKLFSIIVLLLTGFAMLYLSQGKRSNIYNHQGKETSVTVIDLSNKNGAATIFLIIGITFLASALTLILHTYFFDTRKNETNATILTEQENRIVSMIKMGKSNKEIAIELCISVSTVKTHINNIYNKLQIKSRRELLQNQYSVKV